MVQISQRQGLKQGVLILLGVALAGAWLMLSQNQHESPFQMIFDNGALIKVEVADTPATRERGLSGRPGLNDHEGLLFVFERPDRYAFWMKDMNFKIDILWFNEQCALLDLTEDLAPDTYPNIYRPPAPAKYVLETRPGWAQTNQVGLGTKFDCPSPRIK